MEEQARRDAAGADSKPVPPRPARNARPGPQPHNQIADTFEEQVRRALRPESSVRQRRRRRLAKAVRRMVRQYLAAIGDELAELVEHYVDRALAARKRRARR
jgi:hypothetical protein